MHKKLPAGLGLYRTQSGIIYTHRKYKGREFNRSTRTRDPQAAKVEAQRLFVAFVKRVDSGAHPDSRFRGKGRIDELAALDIAEVQKRGRSEPYIKAITLMWGVILRTLKEGLTVHDIIKRHPRTGEPTIHDFAVEYEGARRAKGIRGQTIVRETAAIRRALKRAKREGLIDVIPEDWPKLLRDPKDKRRAGKYWAPEIRRTWMQALHQDARDEAVMVMVTGLRATEVKRIQFSWAEPAPPGFETPYILRVPDWAAKKRRERMLGLPEIGFEIMRRRFEADPNAEFVMSQGNFERHRAEVSQLILGGKKKPPRRKKGEGRSTDYAKGTQYNITLRDLRHSYLSDALAESADATAVMRAAGHHDLRTTEIYMSSTEERIARAGARAVQLLRLDGGGPSVEDLSQNVNVIRKNPVITELYGQSQRGDAQPSCLTPSDKYAQSLAPIDTDRHLRTRTYEFTVEDPGGGPRRRKGQRHG